MTQFSELDLSSPLQSAIRKAGYTTPTPIQEQAIPQLLEGRDLLGIAQTGTGKTAAFALPILNHLDRNKRRAGPKNPRVLILTPTRELASQIDASFGTYSKDMRIFRALVFGGVGQNPQIRAMARGVDILTATPGRLLDLINQGHIKLDRLEIFVLDEADRMLDMGFIHDIRKVISLLPVERQTLLFSATMPSDIANLAQGLLRDPAKVEITPQATTVERISQSVLYVDKPDKRKLLISLLKDGEVGRALVFTRTKHGANRVVTDLDKVRISAAAIHGNKSQTARERALSDFKSGKVRVLVATDIAARGIDVKGLSHVINFDLPNEPESYVHRIGRTARAGAEGAALSFCDAEERYYLRDIEHLIRQSITVDESHPYHSEEAANARIVKPKMQGGRGKGGGGAKGQGHHRDGRNNRRRSGSASKS